MCAGLASVARKLCTTYVDPQGITSLVASRLIALDKCPGMRPIGVGETPRRIIGKAIMTVVKADIREVAGVLQLCAGQEAGSEAAIHAICASSYRTVTQKMFACRCQQRLQQPELTSYSTQHTLPMSSPCHNAHQHVQRERRTVHRWRNTVLK